MAECNLVGGPPHVWEPHGPVDVKCRRCGVQQNVQSLRERMVKDSRAEVESILTLAGLAPTRMWELANQYWPIAPDYDSVRRPWWLAQTSLGLIRLGWRKRVLEIDWSATGIAAIVTEDDVTKESTMVHAYRTAKAVEYLQRLRELVAARKVAPNVAPTINVPPLTEEEERSIREDYGATRPRYATTIRLDVLRLLATLDADRADAARALDLLHLQYVDCAQCGALLMNPTTPPHCNDCNVDDEHQAAWEDKVR